MLRVKRKEPRGRLQVAWHDKSHNRRVHLLSGLGINTTRTDGYETVTSWGTTPHETGDENYLVGTGPAATDVFEDVNTDGLGNKIIGTGFNCSGGVTPWGTVFSAEENFQGNIARFTEGDDKGKIDTANSFYVGVQEEVKPNGTQLPYIENGKQFPYIPDTVGGEFGLVGEKYGWMVEIDPRDPKSRAKKHTALGRFRHENIAVRADAGGPARLLHGRRPPRRSLVEVRVQGTIKHPTDPSNSTLFEDGTLYVARFNSRRTGTVDSAVARHATNPTRPSTWSRNRSSCSPHLRKRDQGDRNGLNDSRAAMGSPGRPIDGGFFAARR